MSSSVRRWPRSSRMRTGAVFGISAVSSATVGAALETKVTLEAAAGTGIFRPEMAGKSCGWR